MKLFKRLLVVILIASTLTITACMTHKHVIGDGGKGSQVETERQWWVLFGLVPLNNVNTATMAKGAKDYTIVTQTSFLDYVISAFTGIVSINCRTVEVTR